MITKQATGIDKQLDDAWSLLVKIKADNMCEYCYKQTPLNSHHVYSRSKKSTRWSLSNGVCLCVGHHTFSSTFSAHKTPTEFTEWVLKKRGEKWFNSLRLDAHKTVKWSAFEKSILLEDLKNQIKKLKSQPNNALNPVAEQIVE